MNEKILYFVSFIFGSLILAILIGGLARLISKDNSSIQDNDPTIHIEKGKSYENKKETSFKVLQVLGNAALATEASDKIGSDVMYHGNTVLVLGENFYSDQIVTVKNPQRVGTYSYTTNGGIPKTVPVIDGEMK